MIQTGRVMFTTRNRLRSWRRDLHLFISQLWGGVPKKVQMRDSKKPNTLDTVKVELKELQATQSRLGPGLLVKGEIWGSEDLIIDGSVEGVVCLSERTLVIGPAANVTADIAAGEVVIRGIMKGNVHAKGRIEIGNAGSVNGDLTTPQIFIEDGARFKGSIEIEKGAEKQTRENVPSRTELAPANAGAAAPSANNI